MTNYVCIYMTICMNKRSNQRRDKTREWEECQYSLELITMYNHEHTLYVDHVIPNVITYQ